MKTELIDLTIYPCLRDHTFNAGGISPPQAVYPAVEAMQVLTAAVYRQYPLEADAIGIRNARFDKFLPLPPEAESVPVVLEFSEETDGWAAARLCSRKQMGSSGMTRKLDHAVMEFQVKKSGNSGEAAAVEPMSGIGSGEYRIPTARLYEDLVPFGPMFHHLTEDIRLDETGAQAKGVAPEHITAPGLLGSPFPLDAAFHCACAWGQRYAGLVAFPVGFAERRNFRPVHPRSHYHIRVKINESAADRLVCDIGIFLEDGSLADQVTDLLMRDVSGGRWKPPEWVRVDGSPG